MTTPNSSLNQNPNVVKESYNRGWTHGFLAAAFLIFATLMILKALNE